MLSDPVADLLTRIRNANMAYRDSVEMPASKLKAEIARILHEEKFLRGYRVFERKGKRFLKVELHYGPDKQRRILRLERVSKPGRRVYCRHRDIPRVKGGYGIVILSTSSGVMKGEDAHRSGVGGEVLCRVW